MGFIHSKSSGTSYSNTYTRTHTHALHVMGGFGSSSGSQHQMEGRPLVASAAGGSISSLILWVVQESLRTQRDYSLPPAFELEVASRNHHSFPLDFWAGLIVGFFLWPCLETLVLVKQWLTLTLRNRIAGLTSGGGKLYKIIS